MDWGTITNPTALNATMTGNPGDSGMVGIAEGIGLALQVGSQAFSGYTQYQQLQQQEEALKLAQKQLQAQREAQERALLAGIMPQATPSWVGPVVKGAAVVGALFIVYKLATRKK